MFQSMLESLVVLVGHRSHPMASRAAITGSMMLFHYLKPKIGRGLITRGGGSILDGPRICRIRYASYKFPYTNASPINAPNFYNAYNSNLIVGDPAGNRIGFTGMYSNSTDTMALLINYFKLNTQNPPPPPPPPPSGIVNGSFETPSTSSYSYRPTGGSWTFAVSSGIQHNGSAWGAPNAPDGVQTAFLQDGTNGGNGTISQSIYLPSSGTYTVSFQAALRAYQTSPTPMSFKVTFDSTVVGSFSPTSRSFSSFTTTPISLTAGYHTLSFVGTGAAPDTSDFINSVYS